MYAYAKFARRLLFVEPNPEATARAYDWSFLRISRRESGVGLIEVSCEACGAPVRIGIRSRPAAARRRLLFLALLGAALLLLGALFTGRVGSALTESSRTPVTLILGLAALLSLPWLLRGGFGRRHHLRPFIRGYPRFESVRHRIG
jgi:hypothetical protein